MASISVEFSNDYIKYTLVILYMGLNINMRLGNNFSLVRDLTMSTVVGSVSMRFF